MNLRRLGDTLRRTRRSKGLTIAQVATAAGFSRSTLVYVEKGEQEIGLCKFVLLAEALAERPDYLLRLGTRVEILVIDDDQGRLRWFQDVLEAAGHNVRLANTADTALDQIHEMQFDVVFFDHDIGPGMTGSQLAYHIFAFPKKMKRPSAVWIHTSNSVGADNIEAKCRSAGVRIGRGKYEDLIKNPKGLTEAVTSLLL